MDLARHGRSIRDMAATWPRHLQHICPIATVWRHGRDMAATWQGVSPPFVRRRVVIAERARILMRES
jgi:cell envelope opacity-associated protein A